MSDQNKKRDAAQDLADFLLSDELKKSKQPLQAVSATKEEAKTTVLEKNPTAVVHSEVTDITQTNKKLNEIPIDFSKPAYSTVRSQNITNEVSKLIGGAEAISVAQARITELEKERDTLRDEIEKLLVTSEALQRTSQELKAQNENLEKKQKDKIEVLEEEKMVLKNRLGAREKELLEVKKINEEMDSRFQNDLKKIRVREREYENKNMILKAESSAVSRSKDEMILDLKKKLDQLQFETDNFKGKVSDSESYIEQLKDRQSRTVKALRVALNILEGSDFEDKFKKASGDE